MMSLQTSESNILVVDDTPDNLRLLAMILESQDYIVRTSLNGKMALQAAQLEPPDLILLDINMPEIDGYEVCEQLKKIEETRHVPIIFISALDQTSDKVRAFELGGQDYINKPFEVSEVLARVKNQLVSQQQKKLLLQKIQQLQQENQDLRCKQTEYEQLVFYNHIRNSEHRKCTNDGIQYRQEIETQRAIALRQTKLYEAAQAQIEELERLNQMKDDFISAISHEIRTPITSMKMVIKLLTTMTVQGCNLIDEISKFSEQSHKVVQYFKVLQEECDRELALVEDLLNLQHIETGTYASQLVPISLQHLLPHLAEPFESRAQNQQQTLQINLDDDLPPLNLDSLVISRIITELLSNACKYTPAGGTISISAIITQDTTTTNSSNYLQLTISNTGVEINPKHLPHIFDKFYRIPNNDPWKHGGTGLGLAMVKKLVEQIGGMVRVESTNDRTCFTVRLKI